MGASLVSEGKAWDGAVELTGLLRGGVRSCALGPAARDWRGLPGWRAAASPSGEPFLHLFCSSLITAPLLLADQQLKG